MISVLIVGKGNVATHLCNAFNNIDKIKVSQINSRKLNSIPKADVTILAVSDDAIAEVSAKINNDLVVHTSGSVSLKDLKNTQRKGVFYMLQTFSSEKKVDFNEVPFCIETEDKSDFQLLESLAKLIGKKVYRINSEQRKSLHVAAVFVNNFTNHLYKIGNDICDTYNVPFEVLKPLIKETALKLDELTPQSSQTGPAVRNDKKTIKKHLNLLNKSQQNIYNILTKSIQNGN